MKKSKKKKPLLQRVEAHTPVRSVLEIILFYHISLIYTSQEDKNKYRTIKRLDGYKKKIENETDFIEVDKKFLPEEWQKEKQLEIDTTNQVKDTNVTL